MSFVAPDQVRPLIPRIKQKAPSKEMKHGNKVLWKGSGRYMKRSNCLIPCSGPYSDGGINLFTTKYDNNIIRIELHFAIKCSIIWVDGKVHQDDCLMH